jgi:hypothetical protein
LEEKEALNVAKRHWRTSEGIAVSSRGVLAKFVHYGIHKKTL